MPAKQKPATLSTRVAALEERAFAPKEAVAADPAWEQLHQARQQLNERTIAVSGLIADAIINELGKPAFSTQRVENLTRALMNTRSY